MDETITRGDAEKVPQKDIGKAPAWYIPHHGVYHPQKPGKICVVFDCFARFKETCLNDSSSPEPLKSNHILTMKSTIISPPPGKFVKEDLYIRKRWRRVQLLANNFWSRWKKEYLLNLQNRQRWTKDRRNAQVNDIVLLKDDGIPRNKWKLAKVMQVHPGKDGRVRTLKLLLSDPTLDKMGRRTSKPVYLERPIQKTVTLLEAD